MIEIIRVREKTFRGASYRYCETVADASWYTFDDEQHVRERWWHVRPGDVVLDAGACFGSYALPALALGAYVYAFSPDPADTELFVRNLEENGWRDRCEVVPTGLHGREGFFDPLAATFHETPGDGRLPVSTLDGFLESHPGLDRVDWLKLDVEGAEGPALAAGKTLLTRFLPRVLVELHLFHDANCVSDVATTLGALEYEMSLEINPPVAFAYFCVPALHGEAPCG